MSPDTFFARIVEPTLTLIGNSPTINIKNTNEARVLVMACAGQESRWTHRRQLGIGEYYPQKVGARSYWQFESTWGGPVAINDILQKAPSQIAAICSHLEIHCDEHAIYEACAWNDMLACAMARLLLWLDPDPLPALGKREEAWQYYLRNWRPGAPHRHTWDGYYDQSMAVVTSGVGLR